MNNNTNKTNDFRERFFRVNDEYRVKFGEGFPIMMIGNLLEEELIEFMQHCIDSNEKYAPEYDDDCLY